MADGKIHHEDTKRTKGKTCALCGAPIRRACKYCSACALIAQRRKKREWRKRKTALRKRPAREQNRFQKKPRSCLACGKEFMSAGPWNRRCPACRHDEAFRRGPLPRGTTLLHGSVKEE